LTTPADIDVERRGEVVVARLGGEVDMTNASYVGDELRGCVSNDATALVVDLSGTRYVDSAAIELFFDLARRLGRRRQQLRLILPPDSPLKRVLTLTDIQNVAAVHEGLDSALADA
jgi:anti-sigma B factor antagonist